MEASLWQRKQSPYYFACFAGSDGRRVKKSTKQTDRGKAWSVCLEWARAADLARRGFLTEAQARKVVSEIIERAGGQPLSFHTAEQWLQNWTTGKSQTKAEKTAVRYQQVVRDFLAHLGKRAKLNITQISVQDLQSFRNTELASGKSARTCNLALTIVGSAFNAARRQGFILTNPAEAIEALPENGTEKDTFRSDQIVALVDAATGDWKSAILFGFYTGARLLDVADMRWKSVNLSAKIIRFVPRKTQKHVTIPMHPELERIVNELPSLRDGVAFLFPALATKATKGGSGGEHGLSNTFKGIMRKAKIVGSISHPRHGKGRATSSLSFHSLRHSFNSAMANAGVPQEIRQKLTGHSTAEMNKIYTHHELESLRTAISVIPSVVTTMPD